MFIGQCKVCARESAVAGPTLLLSGVDMQRRAGRESHESKRNAGNQDGVYKLTIPEAES